jgi:uncharacterized repeat protein (TIGR01451 family)
VEGTIPDATFTVNVAGPSFSSPEVLTFHFSGGVITDNDQTLSPLIPGDYTVSEPGVPANWHLVGITPSQPITVAANSTCAANNVTVTNDYDPGCLAVHKEITGIAGVEGTIPDATFTVNVAGPSFSSPEVLTFHFSGGVITDNDQTLSPLIPGNYTVSEPGVPPNWHMVGITPSQPIEVAAGSSCAANNVTVTNDYDPGCLRVVKELDKSDVAGGTPADGQFIINVSGPSYPEASVGHNLTFNLTNGIISGFQDLPNLIPGDYTVNETSMPDNWELVGYSPSQTVSVGAGAQCGTVNITVTNKYDPADVQVVKTGNITYTIIVSNAGPSPALNVTVNDPLPGNLTWQISSSPSPSGFTTIGIVSGNLTGTITSLDAGEYASVTVEAAIDGHSDSPLLANSVTVMTITPESNISNNTDDADIGPKPA